MRLIVLGAAAGGGLPQWNCGCRNCRRARAGDPLVRPRTQCGIAVEAAGGWILCNASPDLRQQLQATRALDPAGRRGSPITDVVLTGAEIDASLGLLTLREGHVFSVHGTRRTLDALDANPLFRALPPDRVTRRPAALDEPLRWSASAQGVEISLFAVPGKVPLYLESPEALTAIGAAGEDTVGIELRQCGRRAYFIPGCAAITESLAARIGGAGLVLFDGTLWADDEMVRLGLGEKTGRRMGHLSMSGSEGSLAAFTRFDVARKIYIHVNNSNPVLAEDSPERAAIEEAGWEVAWDGMEIRV